MPSSRSRWRPLRRRTTTSGSRPALRLKASLGSHRPSYARRAPREAREPRCAAPAQPGLGQEQWRGGSLRDEDLRHLSRRGSRCQLAECSDGELCDLEINMSNPKTPSTNPRRRRGVRQTAHKLLVGTVSGTGSPPPCRRCPWHLRQGAGCPSGAPIQSWGTFLPRRFGGSRGGHRVALRRREPPIERYEP